MLKIMIVDDESLLRMAVKSLLDWEANGFIMLPDASNGETALQLIAQEAPDILLTDIKMPGMDGVTLIKRIETAYPQIKTIVLSNYDDFNYVKEALTHGAVDYILKANITPENLITVINKLKEKFLTDERMNSESLKRENEIKKSFQFLKNEFLKNLINGKVRNLTEIAQNNEDYLAGLQNKKFIVAALLADDAAELAQKYQGEEAALLQNTIRGIMNEILATGSPSIICSPDHYACIIYMDGCSESGFMSGIYETLTRFQTAVFRFTNISFTVGVSGIKETPADLPAAHQESTAAAAYRFYLGKGKIYRHGEVALKEEDPRVKWMSKRHLRWMVDTLEKGNMEEINGFFADCLTDIAQQRYDINPVKQLLTDFIVFLRSVLIEALDEDEMDFIGSDAVANRFNQCESLGTITDLFLEQVSLIATHLKRDRAERYSDIVGKTLQNIRANYDKDISLHSVAAQINVNPSYLSRLFLKETGQNFIDYLTEHRVRKAMQFLEESNLRVHEVGEKIGYQNSKYFNRVFKKKTGLSPHQYRVQSKK